MDRQDGVLAKNPVRPAFAHPFMAPHTEALARNGLAVTYALDESVAHDGVRVLACVQWSTGMSTGSHQGEAQSGLIGLLTNYSIGDGLASRISLLSPGR
jgi:hypothetical protein